MAGVCSLGSMPAQDIEWIQSRVPVTGLWGVGGRTGKRLNAIGIEFDRRFEGRGSPSDPEEVLGGAAADGAGTEWNGLHPAHRGTGRQAADHVLAQLLLAGDHAGGDGPGDGRLRPARRGPDGCRGTARLGADGDGGDQQVRRRRGFVSRSQRPPPGTHAGSDPADQGRGGCHARLPSPAPTMSGQACCCPGWSRQPDKRPSTRSSATWTSGTSGTCSVPSVQFGEAAIGLGQGGLAAPAAWSMNANSPRRATPPSGQSFRWLRRRHHCRRRVLPQRGDARVAECFRTRRDQLYWMGKTTAAACRGALAVPTASRKRRMAPDKVASRASATSRRRDGKSQQMAHLRHRSQAKGVVPSAGPPPMASRCCPFALVASIPTRRGSLRTARVSKPIEMASPSGDGTVSPSAPEQNGKEPRLVGAA